ncbi:hypothetical protein AB0B85_31140 [Micromonospora sp. NPDC049044]|uniref:hypothetical protein n=1 Tax=Micromonospora sp. NPDC049044 TaxID=3154827 RepID=UPI0033D76253
MAADDRLPAGEPVPETPVPETSVPETPVTEQPEADRDDVVADPGPPAEPESPAAAPGPPAAPPAAEGPADRDGDTGNERRPETVQDSVHERLGKNSPVGKDRQDTETESDAFLLGRADEDIARRLSGDRFATRIGSIDGPVAMGTNAVAYQFTLPGGEQITLARYELTADFLIKLRRRYFRGPSFAPALRTLRAQRVLVLRGPEGSGRTAAGHALLESLRQDGLITKVGGLVMPDGVSVGDVTQKPEVFPAGWGMVLELRDGTELAMGARVEAYRTMAAKAQGYVVLLGPPAGEEETNQYEVPHDWPGPAEVLESYLLAELPDSFPDAQLRELLDDEAVTGYLANHRRPGQVVKLAVALVDGVPRGRSPGAVVASLEPDWRMVARRAFEDALPATDPFGAPRRQALRTAYAIFDGLELVDVFSAAEELLGMLRFVEAPDSSPARPVFDDGLEKLLFPDMLGEDSAENGKSSPTRRAMLRSPQLSDAFLDVAWNDYDTTRLVLLYWLDRVVVEGRVAIRLRAAQAAGKLALYDFDKVMADLIRPWARDPSGVRRQAAAWALEQVSRNELFVGRVRRQVSDWVLSNDAALHDTAAKVYATTFGAALPVIAMTHLRTIATDPRQLPYRSVGRAVANVYLTDPSGPVLDHLDAWLDDAAPEVRAHTTWALLFLARILDNDRPTWPRLLLDVEAAPERQPVLARLWTAALAASATAFPAWDLLRQWLELPYGHGANDGDLAKALLRLTTAALDGAALRRRGLWHIRLWHRRRPDDRLLSDLIQRLTEG